MGGAVGTDPCSAALARIDMLGNALEWCDDVYRPDLSRDSSDSGSTGAVLPEKQRVVRGGSFDNNARSMRSAFRTSDKPDHRTNTIGFRPVRTLP